MNQHFNEDVMQDLMADSPSMSADDAFEHEMFEDESFADGFDEDVMEDDLMMDSADEFNNAEEERMDEEGFEDGFVEDYGDEFAEEYIDVADALEEAVADAMDAENGDEFLGRLISGIRGIAGTMSRGAGTVRRAARTAQRVAGQAGRMTRQIQGLAGSAAGNEAQSVRRRIRRAAPSGFGGRAGVFPGLLQQLLPLLQRQAAQGADELDVFEDLADWFEQEDADEALPVLAGVAARAALRPLIRRGGTMLGRAASRQLVRGAVQGARSLIARQGPQGVRALRPIARSVGRMAVRHGMRTTALPSAIRQTAARIAAQPSLARRLSQPSAALAAPRTGSPRSRIMLRGGAPRRFVVNGPVEIIVRR